VTNLSNKQKKKKILTPESAVLFVPASAGILIGIILIFIFFIPEITNIRNKNADILILNQRIEYIPFYEKKLSTVIDLLKKRITQSNRLISLVAGKKELRTILSKLNELSISNNLKITELKPEDTVTFASPKDESRNTVSTSALKKNDSKNNPDKLLFPSTKKYPFNLNLNGQYEDILNFLRDLELLDTIVLSSALELNLETKDRPRNNDKLNKLKKEDGEISMKLKLTFYGRDNNSQFNANTKDSTNKL